MEHSQRKHALLASSSASRWLNCTPSARLEEKFIASSKIQAPSSYAEEGTLAHEFADITLRNLFFSKYFSKSAFNKELKKIKKNKHFSAGMGEQIDKYVSYVQEQYSSVLDHDPIILIEERVDFSHIVPEGFGTVDVVIISDGHMEVIDLKYGMGVRVFAEKNQQLSLYALAAFNKYDLLYGIGEITLTIVQPRLDHISSWETSPRDLLDWGSTIVKPAAALAYRGEGVLRTGDHCKFCKVKALCSEMAKKNLEMAKYDFEEPYLLKDDEILEIFKTQPMFVDWVNSVSEYILGEAIKGKHWPGFKVVEGRSVRKWSDERKVIDKLMLNSMVSDFTTRKLIGIPAFEKNMDKDLFEDQFKELIVKQPGKPTLVQESDKRPAMSGLEQARIDFADPID